MTMALRWTVLVSALAAGVMLVAGGPAGAAGAASTGSSAPVAARTAVAGGLGNYRISGDEDAIGCLTAHRCVAVGFGGRKAPGQVVTVVGGKQVRVGVARAASNLVAVSCPNRFGCWAVGPPRKGSRWVLVKIGPTGSIRQVTSVRLPAGVTLTSISCTSRTSCEVFGVYVNPQYVLPNKWYLAAWNGSKLSHQAFTAAPLESYDQADGISCWQATCVAVGAALCGGSACSLWTYGIMTTSGGKLETAAFPNTEGWFSGISCVSSSTCYATSSNGIVTLDDGAVAATDSAPVSGSIECAGTTCWDTGMAGSTAEFVMITNGAPTGTPVPDAALTAPSSIARRGDGFAAVGKAAVNGGSRVSEVVTN